MRCVRAKRGQAWKGTPRAALGLPSLTLLVWAVPLLRLGCEQEQKTVSAERKADQKLVDEQLLKIIAGTEHMKAYLSTNFSLSKGVFPHALKF
jgi:hypothetical protein